VAASDPDGGDTVTLNVVGLPAGATMTPSLPTTANPVTSTFSWTPTIAQAGTYVLTFSATDTSNQEALCSVTVKASSTCGNGIVEPSAGEQCDGGTCCTSGCQFATGVPPRRINEIVLGKRALSADTALRLAAFFGTSEGFWLGLQADYDLEEARRGMSRELLRVEQARAEYAIEWKSRA